MRPETIFKQIQILYYVILLGLAVFGMAAYYFVSKTGNVMLIEPSLERSIYTILIILVFVGIPVSYVFHKKSVAHIDPELSLSDKLVKYRKVLFIKLITLEGLAMFSLIGYIIAGAKPYLLMYIILVVVYLISYPGKKTIGEELQLENGQMDF
jgi:hypothetical protein